MEDGKEKYVMNYLNFSVENFGVTEKGSLRHIIEDQRNAPPDDPSTNDGQIALNEELLD
jgi:hypothetical protein